jgi:geranylgeranyl diphosphate synthase type II
LDVEKYLKEKKEIVDRALEAYLLTEEGDFDTITKAMRYSLFAGGKRVRPILCIAGAEAVGGTIGQVLPVACALELIHTYSLIHDDLPAMDNDDYRRGVPTNHKVFGEAVAILAGDALLTEAFQLMTRPKTRRNTGHERLLDVIDIISYAAGYHGIIRGQVADLLSEGKDVDSTTIEYIHTHKTGVLITASTVAGAILGGGSKSQITQLKRYSEKVGLAFQIADDLLDVEGKSSIMGKEPGSDRRSEKATYIKVMGVKASKEMERRLIEEAIDAIRSFDQRAEPLRAIAYYIIKRRH